MPNNLVLGRLLRPLYLRWRKMMTRCYDDRQKSYARYGGRGILVCQQWYNNWHAFETWALVNGFSPDLQLDRIDNDGSYCPENCRWVTPKVNANNKSDTVILVIQGESMTISDAMLKFGLTRRTIVHRMKLGLTGDALVAPAAHWRGDSRTCKNGHPRNAENTRLRKDGERRCVVCERDRDHKRRTKA